MRLVSWLEHHVHELPIRNDHSDSESPLTTYLRHLTCPTLVPALSQEKKTCWLEGPSGITGVLSHSLSSYPLGPREAVGKSAALTQLCRVCTVQQCEAKEVWLNPAYPHSACLGLRAASAWRGGGHLSVFCALVREPFRAFYGVSNTLVVALQTA